MSSCIGQADSLELGAEDDGPIADDRGGPDDALGLEPEESAAIEAGCTFVPKIIVYTPGFNSLAPEIADKMDAYGARCAQYYFMIPAVKAADSCIGGTDECLKLEPRPTAPQLRAKSPHGNFHALAEFHWHHWAAWIARSPGTRTWTDAGLRFRRAMADAGYDVQAGDTWSLQELHSGLRRDLPDARANVREAVLALLAGDPAYVSPVTGLRASTRRGVIFAIGANQESTFLDVLEDNLKDWLEDSAFWADMRRGVRFFAQEVYPTPSTTCVPGSTLANRAKAVNAFTMHVARLAFGGDGARSDAARAFFDRTYVPLLGGVWPSAIYGKTQDLTPTQAMHFISTQIYATRLWAAQHAYPDARVGLAWRVDGTPEDNQRVTERVTSSLLHAYADEGSRAAHACSPSGAFTWCACSVAGAKFNPSWASTFMTW